VPLNEVALLYHVHNPCRLLLLLEGKVPACPLRSTSGLGWRRKEWMQTGRVTTEEMFSLLDVVLCYILVVKASRSHLAGMLLHCPWKAQYEQYVHLEFVVSS
jgi:hypothetical protein